MSTAESLCRILPVIGAARRTIIIFIFIAVVFIILITLQANLPTLRFLDSRDYHPPDSLIDAVSDAGTMLPPLLGADGSIALVASHIPVDSLRGRCSGHSPPISPSGGRRGGLGRPTGQFSVALPAVIALPLFPVLSGLAVVNIPARALERIAQGERGGLGA